MGVHDMIARNKQEYVDIAVKLGTDSVAREAAERKIRENVHKLFFKDEAVQAWSRVLQSIAPSRAHCDVDGGDVAGDGDNVVQVPHTLNEGDSWDLDGATGAFGDGNRDEL